MSLGISLIVLVAAVLHARDRADYLIDRYSERTDENRRRAAHLVLIQDE